MVAPSLMGEQRQAHLKHTHIHTHKLIGKNKDKGSSRDPELRVGCRVLEGPDYMRVPVWPLKDSLLHEGMA